MNKLKNYNGADIPQDILNSIGKYVDDPEENFNVANVLRQNLACSYLCSWVINIVTFNRINKTVIPLKKMQEDASAIAEAKKKELEKVLEKVRMLMEKVRVLNKQLSEAMEKKQEVQDDANACNAKLESAKKLVEGLAGENARWKKLVEYLKKNKLSCIGDCMIAAAFVSYIGAFSARLRKYLWFDLWIKTI